MVASSQDPLVSWKIGSAHGSLLTVDGAGRSLCLLREMRVNEEGEPLSSSGVLMATREQARGWEEVGRVPLKEGQSYVNGVLVADVGDAASDSAPGARLQVLWTAAKTPRVFSVFFADFDLATQAWSSVEQLAVGTSVEDSYWAEDLLAQSDGTLVAAIATHRSPKKPWELWSTGLRVRAPATAAWSKPLIASSRWTGIAPDLQLQDGALRVTYRSNGPNNFGIYSRRMDGAGGWLEEQRRVDMHATKGVVASNTSVSLVDDAGGLYVLYGSGTDHAGDGTLRASYSRHGATEGKVGIEVDVDPDLLGGNKNPRHYSLARGPGEQVFAIYSKASEKHAHLYSAALMAGERVGTPRRIASGKVGDFEMVSGTRSVQFTSSLRALVSGNGVVQAYAQRWPALVKSR